MKKKGAAGSGAVAGGDGLGGAGAYGNGSLGGDDSRAKLLERENTTLNVELTFNKERLRACELERESLSELYASSQRTLQSARQDAEDVLQHTKRELTNNASLIKEFETTIRSLREELKESKDEEARLREEQSLLLIKSQQLDKATLAKEDLQEMVCQQDSLIAKQGEELKRVYEQLQQEEARTKIISEECTHWRYRAATTTTLHFFFKKPCLVTKTKHKCVGSRRGGSAAGSGNRRASLLSSSAVPGPLGESEGGSGRAGSDRIGDQHPGQLRQPSSPCLQDQVPTDREANSILHLGHRHIVYFGGRGSGGSTGASAASAVQVDDWARVYMLSLDDFTWCCAGTIASNSDGSSNPLGVRSRLGHSATPMSKSKVAVIGGWNAAATSTSASSSSLGGARAKPGSYPGEVLTLNTDTMRWQAHRPRYQSVSAAAGSFGGEASAILAREGHATACLREKVYVFGGTSTATGFLMSDLCHLDFESMQVGQHFPTTSTVPCARRGASLNSSELDARWLIVFGGRDVDDHALSDVYVFELDKSAWFFPSIGGTVPRARSGHLAEAVGKFLIVHGGQASDGSRLNDTWMLDTESWEWECVHHIQSLTGNGISHPQIARAGGHQGAAPAAGAGVGGPHAIGNSSAAAVSGHHHQQLKGGAHHHTGGVGAFKAFSHYSTIAGNRLFILRPSYEDKLDELEVVEFGFPDEMDVGGGCAGAGGVLPTAGGPARRRTSQISTRERRASAMLGIGPPQQQHQHHHQYVEHLHIHDDAYTTLNSIEVSWEPPTKNVDRIASYRLMLATNTGAVKEVFRGTVKRFKVANLRSNTEYIFCVKAVYADGSHVWSDRPKAFRTR